MPISTQAHAPAGTGRDLSLDFLKGIAMLMVVFFHNLQLNPDSAADNLFMLAANAAVPCFFLVSGTLFFSRTFHMKKHIQRCIQLYLVMVVWRVLYLWFYHTLGTPVPGSLRTLLSYLLFFQSIEGVGTSHFWFIDALLTVMLIAPLLKYCRDTNRRLILYLMALLFLFNQLLADGNLLLAAAARLIGKPAPDVSQFAEISPFSLRHSNYMLYYLLGAELSERKEHISVKAAGLMAAAGLTGLLLIKYLQSGTFRWQGLHITSGYYWISTMLLAGGAYLLAGHLPISSCAPLSAFSKTAGTSTLGIFYLHIPLITLLTPALFCHLAPWNGWIVNMAESLLIVLISCIIVWFGRKIPAVRRLFT